jgi:hypothetical protein
VTVALKDFVAPARTFALAGETITLTLDPEGGVTGLEVDELLMVPVHPLNARLAMKKARGSEYRKADFCNSSIN